MVWPLSQGLACTQGGLALSWQNLGQTKAPLSREIQRAAGWLGICGERATAGFI